MKDLTDAVFFTSSFSGGNNCVEVATNLAATTGNVYVRDTKDREGSLQTYSLAEWNAFLKGVQDGEFNLPQ